MFVVDRVSRPRLIACGMIGCVCILITECVLVARDPVGPGENKAALRAAVAMVFRVSPLPFPPPPHSFPPPSSLFSLRRSEADGIQVYVACYEWMNNVQLSYLGEIFPFHLRAKGISLGVSGICLLNIIWLQAAPTALKNIGWKYYLCFIIPSALASLVVLRWFPDTRGLSLEECARVFGDEGELFGGEKGGRGDEEGGMVDGSGSEVRESKETGSEGGEVATGERA